jgi:hypothetical protein
MNIAKMKQLYAAGQPINAILTAAGLDDADPGEWKRILGATHKSKPRRTTKRPSRRVNYASQVATATLTLVKRVNERKAAEIPFTGEPWPLSDDEYAELQDLRSQYP